MGFIGARLCHVIVEHPGYYMRAPFQILKFWQGGFVFYGGVLFALVGAIYYLRIKKQNIRAWMEMFTPVIISGYVIGRFATLLSGSGYGKPTDVPWAIIYPPGPEAPAGIPLHPTPIYSMLWNAVFLFYVMRVESRPVAQYQLTKKPGNLLLVYGIYHGVGRVLIEQFREDYRGELILGLSFSTWMSGALIVLCLFFLLKPTRSQKSAEGARP